MSTRTSSNKVQIDRHHLSFLLKREREQFVKDHPESLKLFERAKKSMLSGVPMQWMMRWSSPFPIFVKEAQGQYIWDRDGKRYIDFCLGDTGSMCGHAPPETTEAIIHQIKKGGLLKIEICTS